jgi:hypothetical protein
MGVRIVSIEEVDSHFTYSVAMNNASQIVIANGVATEGMRV